MPPRVERGQPRAKMAVLDLTRGGRTSLIKGLACCSGQAFQVAQEGVQDAPGNFFERDLLVAGYCATPGGAGAAIGPCGSLGF